MSYWVYPTSAPVTELFVTPPSLVIPLVRHGGLIDDELGGITPPEKDGGSNKSGEYDESCADDEDDVGRHDDECDDGGCGEGSCSFKGSRRNDWRIRSG